MHSITLFSIYDFFCDPYLDLTINDEVGSGVKDEK